MRRADEAYVAIVAMIEDQGLAVGDRLPSESRLGTILGVSRPVIREALARLASDGVTEARLGAGSFVTRLPSEQLKRHIQIDQLPATMGTYEVRFVLEAEAARLAAMRRSTSEMADIDGRLEDLCVALHSTGAADEEDMALHRAITIASGNKSFTDAFDALRVDIGRLMKAGVDISRARSTAEIEMMLGEHADIVEAIRMGDPDRAAVAMRWHLSQGRRRLMS